MPILYRRLSADESLCWLFKKFLKTRIAPNRVPFPAMFQVVYRDTVIDAVHCARRFEQSFEERKREILLTNASIDQSEVAIHNHAVNGIFRLRLQFDSTRPSLIASSLRPINA